jgi:hypothetical protein
MFVFTARTLLEELETHAPDVLRVVRPVVAPLGTLVNVFGMPLGHSTVNAASPFAARWGGLVPGAKSIMQDFEKLGVFYLGRRYDLDRRTSTGDLVLYDSKDLVTHAVCIGMTGSGKTGLCLALIEEALLDGIPVLLIDPKGDLANLCLTFPELRPQDFAPWVNEEDARRKGLEVDAYAAQQAELWRKGLAAWGEDGARIQRLRDAADVTIYTPGSTAGLPVSIVKSFAAPPAALRDDAELLRDRIGTTATRSVTKAVWSLPHRAGRRGCNRRTTTYPTGSPERRATQKR